MVIKMVSIIGDKSSPPITDHTDAPRKFAGAMNTAKSASGFPESATSGTAAAKDLLGSNKERIASTTPTKLRQEPSRQPSTIPGGLLGRIGDWFQQAGAELGTLIAGPTSGIPTRPKVAIKEDFPDPSIIKVGNHYYAFATGGNGHNLQFSKATSPNGRWLCPQQVKGFKYLGSKDHLPWAVERQSVWAPDVHRLASGKYIMYFSTKYKANNGEGREAIGYAIARSPEGPWEFPPAANHKPLIYRPNMGGDIDPSFFEDSDGKTYIVYKNDGNAEHKADSLWVQQVGADGHTLVGHPFKMNGLTNPGGNGQVTIEAPQIVRHGNEYVVFYSTGSYNDTHPKGRPAHNYTEHYATATSLRGPWKRGPKALLETGGDGGKLRGPGGATVLGNIIVFHNIRRPAADGLVREMMVAKLQWRNGVPFIKGGIPQHSNGAQLQATSSLPRSA